MVTLVVRGQLVTVAGHLLTVIVSVVEYVLVQVTGVGVGVGVDEATGQTVVYRATVSVVTAVEWAGQFVTVAAQLVTV